MRLGEVCQGINYQIIQGSMDTPITGVCYDSRKVEPGNLFVCVVGEKTDGIVCPTSGTVGAVAVMGERIIDQARQRL